MHVVTRFPPSPTGYFHIGSARTALFNYLFTAHHGGVMFLRFEDTDKKRSKREYEDDIRQGLDWLKIPYTLPETYRQSERGTLYKKALDFLCSSGKAYASKEPSKENPDVEVEVIRLKNAGKKISFTDLIRGEVTFETTELGDFVIARNIEEPLYHLTVVVDDQEMGITHVIRGEDHISNTPRQILILEALGYQRPQYAHIPLILAPDRSKLSKRHGAVSVTEYKKEGYLPDAMVNYLALLGWNPGGDRELFSINDLTEKFDLSDVQKGGAIFDIEKLRWFNREYILTMSEESVRTEIEHRMPHKNPEIIAKLTPLIRERINRWGEIDSMVTNGELDYFFSEPALDASKIPGRGSDIAAAQRHLEKLGKLFTALPSSEDMKPEDFKEAVWSYAETEGRGKVLWPLRYALTGREKSPDPFAVAAIVGKKVIQRRIEAAIKALEK